MTEQGNMYLLDWEQFTHYWGNGIGDALKNSDFYDYYTEQWLFSSVFTKNVQIFVLSDGAIKVVFFTQILDYPKCKALRCFWGYGCELDKFLPLANERLEDMARLCDADRIELVGRPGWFRKLRYHLPGIKEGWCTVWRDVERKRSH